MTEPIEVDDPADPRLFDFVELRDGRSPEGAFIVEGLTPLGELVRSEYRTRAVLIAQSKLTAVSPLLQGIEAPLYIGDMQLRLLRKVEELTLYTLQQQERIEQLTKRLAELEQTRP